MSTKKIYVSMHTVPGYGPRIYVPYDHLHELDADFKPLSTWGGYDKDTGKAKGYEFPSTDESRIIKACFIASSRGFTVVNASAENSHEFWA